MKRSDIWFANLEPVIGNEQAGKRHVLIASSDFFNDGGARMVIAMPFTKRGKKQPLHVPVKAGMAGLTVDSFIKTEDIQGISKERLIHKTGEIDQKAMHEVEIMLSRLLGILMFKRGSEVFIPLRYKLTLLITAMIMLPFIVSGYVTYKRFIASVERNANDYTLQLASQIGKNMDNYFKEIDKLNLLIVADTEAMSILKNHGENTVESRPISINEASKMNIFLSMLVHDRQEIKGIFFFSKDGAVFSNLSKNGLYDTEESKKWNSLNIMDNLQITITPPHEGKYYDYGSKKVFSLLKPIRAMYTNELLGVLKIDLEGDKTFEKISAFSGHNRNDRIFITDNDNYIYYPGGSAGDKLNQANEPEILLDGDTFLKSSWTSYVSGLTVTGFVSKSYLHRDAKDLTGFTLVISALALIISFAMTIIFSNRIVKPIRNLLLKMRQVQNGELWIQAQKMSRDEIGLLTEGFNTMVEKVRGLIQEVGNLVKENYETRMRERNAELSALQSQINPHFLYNTLELINMLAMEKNEDEICQISSSLGKLLRYTVDKREKPVYLREEIRFIEAYFKIISIRYGERVKTRIHVEPSLKFCLVPKLIIQPLVENAVKHGLEECMVGFIEVSVCKEAEDILINVRDNGQGMNEGALKALEERIYTEEDEASNSELFGEIKKGYALRNVHKRIQLLYGKKYGITVQSAEGKGSVFILHLPAAYDEEVG